jgi:hypothetical protein
MPKQRCAQAQPVCPSCRDSGTTVTDASACGCEGSQRVRLNRRVLRHRRTALRGVKPGVSAASCNGQSRCPSAGWLQSPRGATGRRRTRRRPHTGRPEPVPDGFAGHPWETTFLCGRSVSRRFVAHTIPHCTDTGREIQRNSLDNFCIARTRRSRQGWIRIRPCRILATDVEDVKKSSRLGRHLFEGRRRIP